MGNQETSKPCCCWNLWWQSINKHPSFFVPFLDEGMWDLFVKNIPHSATSYTISLDKLKQGVSYEFRVVAVNEFGYGEPSSPSLAVSGWCLSPYSFLEALAQSERDNLWPAIIGDVIDDPLFIVWTDDWEPLFFIWAGSAP